MNSLKTINWQTVTRYGLLGSIVAFYFSVIGMVETFAQRNIISTWLSLGHLLLVAGAVGAGYLSAREHKDKPRGAAVTGSIVAGLLTSVFLLLLILFVQFVIIPTSTGEVTFSWRDMFVNMSPGLVDFLTFGAGPVIGSLVLVVFLGLMGGFGAMFVFLPSRLWHAILNSLIWTLGIGLFSENVGQILAEVLGRGFVKIIFANKSLNLLPALIILLVTFSISYLRTGEKAKSKWSDLPPAAQKQGRTVGIVLGIALLLLLPWIVGSFLSQALFMIGLYVMMGLGLNIVVGYAGLLDLGYVAFFAFGAYVMGVLTSTGPLGISDLNFWQALPISVLAGVLWGVILGFPVLRMRGDYLAIVTLGFGEIIRILATSNWLAPIGGGPQGILHIPTPVFFGITMNSPQSMYYLVVAGSALAAFVTIRLRDSRLGRQWMAMREDEDVAEAMGINLVQTKLLAFAIGAAFSALAGAIFAARLGNIFPHSFNLLISINALSLIIVGGLGSIPGVIVGALILVGLPEILREFAEYRLLMYGLLLIIMMLVKPEGFLPEKTRQRELRGEEFALGNMGDMEG